MEHLHTIFQPHIFDRFQQALKKFSCWKFSPTKLIREIGRLLKMIFAYHSPSHLFHGYEPSLEIASQSIMHLVYKIGVLVFSRKYSKIEFHKMVSMSAVNILVHCTMVSKKKHTFIQHGWGNVHQKCWEG